MEHAGDERERQGGGRERDPRGGARHAGAVARVRLAVAAVAVVDAHALRAESVDARVAVVLVDHAAALAHHSNISLNCAHTRTTNANTWTNANAD